MATKITVKTDVGTFTRKTARTYTHIVVVKGFRAERLEVIRQRSLAEERKQVVEYTAILAGDKVIGIRQHPVSRAWDIQCREQSLADGSYVKYLAQSKARIAELEAQGVITADGGNWRGGEASFTVLGWCGRADLATKLSNTDAAKDYRDVRIYTIDGTRVR